MAGAPSEGTQRAIQGLTARANPAILGAAVARPLLALIVTWSVYGTNSL